MDMFSSNISSLGKLNKRTMFQSRQVDKTTKLMMNMERKKVEWKSAEVRRALDIAQPHPGLEVTSPARSLAWGRSKGAQWGCGSEGKLHIKQTLLVRK